MLHGLVCRHVVLRRRRGWCEPPRRRAERDRDVERVELVRPLRCRNRAARNNVIIGVSCFSATSCTAVRFHILGFGLISPKCSLGTGSRGSLATSPTARGATSVVLTDVSCVSNWSCVAVGKLRRAVGAASPLALGPHRAEAHADRFVASDGGIFNYGAGAPFLAPWVASRSTPRSWAWPTMPAGDGYYLVAADGGVFNFGSAQFFGSAGSLHLTSRSSASR